MIKGNMTTALPTLTERHGIFMRHDVEYIQQSTNLVFCLSYWSCVWEYRICIMNANEYGQM